MNKLLKQIAEKYPFATEKFKEWVLYNADYCSDYVSNYIEIVCMSGRKATHYELTGLLTEFFDEQRIYINTFNVPKLWGYTVDDESRMTQTPYKFADRELAFTSAVLKAFKILETKLTEEK